MAWRPEEGLDRADGPCGMQPAQAVSCGALSETSSGSGWSTGTQAVEQQASCGEGLYSLQAQGEHSIKPPAATAAAAPAQHAAVAANGQQQQQQPWQLCMQLPAGTAYSSQEQATPPLGPWQHGVIGNGGGFGAQQQQQQQLFAQQQQAAAAAAADPWSAGLELVAVGAGVDADPELPQLGPLTDPALEALLAPFEDWPFLLQPAVEGSSNGLADATPMTTAAGPSGGQQQAQQLAPAAAIPAALALSNDSPLSGSSGAATTGTTTTATAAAAGSAPSSDGGGSDAGGRAPARRRGGRPRVHHPKPPPAQGAKAAAGADGCATAPVGQPFKKSGRGPKPKYIYGTQEEAADARRERNRKAALESYYRKKEHTQRLQAQIDDLKAENAALQTLLSEMTTTGLCPLLEASDSGIDIWLKHNKGVGAEEGEGAPCAP